MRAAKVQASLRIHAVSPEPPLLAHTSSESRGTFRQKARSLAPLNGLACAVKICHDGMLEDTNSLDGAHMFFLFFLMANKMFLWRTVENYPLIITRYSSEGGWNTVTVKRCWYLSLITWKCVFWDFWPGKVQTSLLSYRDSRTRILKLWIEQIYI